MRRAACLGGLLAVLACTPPIECDTCTALTGVTVIDGTGTPPRAGHTVLLRDSLIAAVGPDGTVELPPGAAIQALPGRYVIPGLVDAHAHVAILRDPTRWDTYDEVSSQQVLLILLAHGITLVRNPAAPLPEGPALRDRIAAGEVLGPTLVVAGPPINIATGPGSADRIRALVRRHAAGGVDAIKLYRLVERADMAAATALADSLDLPVIAHLERTDPGTAVGVGVDAITHAASWHEAMLAPERRPAYRERRRRLGPMRARLDWLEALDVRGGDVRSAARALAESGVTLDPTLVAHAPRLLGRVHDSAAAVRLTPATIRATWAGTLDAIPPGDLARGPAAFAALLGLVRTYWEEGVTLLAGSDLPNAWVTPGVSLHDELRMLHEAGIPALDVIRIATANGAAALGRLDSRGTVEAGKRADLVVLRADPVADLRHSRAIETVWLAGRPLRPDSLLAAAGLVP